MGDAPGPTQWSRVLEEEFRALRSDAPPVPDTGDAAAHLRATYKAIHENPDPTSALCLSGGGIRSATFALGVLQGLAHLGVLGKFDYLSTVSGGGYTGGWLTAWLKRAGPNGREAALRALDPGQSGPLTGATEAPQVDYLRRMCRYLAPKGGASSADFWTLLATLGRNLFLNWLVILPLIGAALLIPRINYGLTESLQTVGTEGLAGFQCLAVSNESMIWLGVTLAGFGIAFAYIALVFSGVGQQWSQVRFLGWCLLPLVAGAIGATNFWAAFPCDLQVPWMAGVSAALPATAWILFGIIPGLFRGGDKQGSAPRSRLTARTVIAAAVSGPLFGLGWYWFATYPFGMTAGVETDQLYAVLAVPFSLALVTISIALFAGVAGNDLDDGALEWWSRCAAWIGLAAFGWLAAGTLVFFCAEWLESGVRVIANFLSLDHRWSTAVLTSLAPLLASITALAARSGRKGSRPSKSRVVGQSLAMPLVILLLLSSIAWLDLRAVEMLEYHTYRSAGGHDLPCPTSASVGPSAGTITRADGSHLACHPLGGGLGEALQLFALFVGVGLLMSYFVPVNRFSLHGMYRERLIRTFLGASRDDRQPNPFTGFDGKDDLRVPELADVRPLHVICTTLDAVSSTSVDGHEKQAQSFTFTPLHVGNRQVGYRPAAEYGSDGGKLGTGVSLGMALSVSGAAASSQLGIYSTPGTAFLMTLANARLGLWFGNPRDDKSWRNSEPPLGVGPIARELLGLTTDSNPFVYLSDGGHYENLGLWEMVARRCRYIVVSDAGADPEYSFSSLSNAIRRIRLDLGIPIEFDPIPITKAGQGHGNPHAAMGVIRYSAMDGASAPPGTILYLRATLAGDEPVDVLNYAKVDPLFPNDSTADQFFDEARFESYRVLGFHTVLAATAGFKTGGGIKELVDAAGRVAGRS